MTRFDLIVARAKPICSQATLRKKQERPRGVVLQILNCPTEPPMRSYRIHRLRLHKGAEKDPLPISGSKLVSSCRLHIVANMDLLPPSEVEFLLAGSQKMCLVTNRMQSCKGQEYAFDNPNSSASSKQFHHSVAQLFRLPG